MAKKKTQPKKAAKKATSSAPSSKKSLAKRVTKAKSKKKSAPTLGRPKVTGEEQLDMLFHEDYESRQIFRFLRVATVKELEQFSPQYIAKLLSKPITDTVNRIRRKLAQKNRYLEGDVNFAVEYQQEPNEQ